MIIKTLISVLPVCFLLACGESPRDVNTQDDAGRVNAMELLTEELGEFSRTDTISTYDRETVFDYIDGAGEVYNSYDFRRVYTARYVSSDQIPLTIEIFDMGTADDAYGVFSYAREVEESGIGGGYEARGGVLCFWQAEYYVCLAADRTVDDLPDRLKELAQEISTKLPPLTAPPRLLSVLPEEGKVRFSERYFHTHQALNYHYYFERENILGLSSESDVVMARYEPGKTVLCLIEFPDAAGAERAHQALKALYPEKAGDFDRDESEPSLYPWWVVERRLLAIVFDAPNKAVAFGLLDKLMANCTDYLSHEGEPS